MKGKRRSQIIIREGMREAGIERWTRRTERRRKKWTSITNDQKSSLSVFSVAAFRSFISFTVVSMICGCNISSLMVVFFSSYFSLPPAVWEKRIISSQERRELKGLSGTKIEEYTFSCCGAFVLFFSSKSFNLIWCSPPLFLLLNKYDRVIPYDALWCFFPGFLSIHIVTSFLLNIIQKMLCFFNSLKDVLLWWLFENKKRCTSHHLRCVSSVLFCSVEETFHRDLQKERGDSLSLSPLFSPSKSNLVIVCVMKRKLL